MLNLETVKYDSRSYIRNIETGTHFLANTDESVIKALENLIRNKERVRLFYGEPNNGEIWHEENDVLGRIGRSMGPAKTPLLINNKGSLGGPAILTSSIMAIVTVKGKWLYRHETFRVPVRK